MQCDILLKKSKNNFKFFPILFNFWPDFSVVVKKKNAAEKSKRWEKEKNFRGSARTLRTCVCWLYNETGVNSMHATVCVYLYKEYSVYKVRAVRWWWIWVRTDPYKSKRDRRCTRILKKDFFFCERVRPLKNVKSFSLFVEPLHIKQHLFWSQNHIYTYENRAIHHQINTTNYIATLKELINDSEKSAEKHLFFIGRKRKIGSVSWFETDRCFEFWVENCSGQDIHIFRNCGFIWFSCPFAVYWSCVCVCVSVCLCESVQR